MGIVGERSRERHDSADASLHISVDTAGEIR